MKYLTIAIMTAGLMIGVANTPPAFAQGKGGGGAHKGQGTYGKKTGPQDGTGNQQGKGQTGQTGKKGKRTGPQDGSGPIHTPPSQPKS